LIHDALHGIVDELISSDTTRNALVARSEDSNDLRDARRLITLDRAGVLSAVHVPDEPHRSLRSLLTHDRRLTQLMNGTKNRIKALCRRHGITVKGVGVYKARGREEALAEVEPAAVSWQLDSLYRHMDFLRYERTAVHRVLTNQVRGIREVELLQSIPGVGPITARTLVAWIIDPKRFRTRSALSSYAGLGIGQSYTNWSPVGRSRASKRGQRAVKRVIFLAANAAIRGRNAFARRYAARIAAGWEHRKAIRDIARTILFTVRAVWTTGEEYQDERVAVPDFPQRTG
jgi:transposase